MNYDMTIKWCRYWEFVDKCKKEYQDNKKNIRRIINEFKAEFPPKFIKEKRIKYIKEEIDKYEKLVKGWTECYQASFDRHDPYWWRSVIKEYYDEVTKKLKKWTTDLYFIENPEKIKKSQITPEMIARAKDFPITELIETNSAGFAHCVSGTHEDKKPSMFCKNNFAYCFTCGFSADAIKLVMVINDLNFIEAVRLLNR